MTECYLEHRDGHFKFYEMERVGHLVNMRWGKIGTNGQSNCLSFESAEKAQKCFDKKLNEKLGKDYQLLSSS
jgi:predicted DNA-binding WGR domain protein